MMEEEVDVEEEKFTLTEAHTKFAKTTNGEVWKLLSKSDRSQVENDDGKVVVHAQGESRAIHDLQTTAEGFHIAKRFEAAGAGNLGRVGIVDAIHLVLGHE